jgi:hypothetical protein
VTGFEWNTLRVGDRVLIHDDLSAAEDFPLHPGVVAAVDGMTWSHDVGIRLANASGATATMLRPLRMQVHRDPRDPSEPCWRCDWEKR